MDILQTVVIFVAVAIILGIGVAVLGSTNIVDCNALVGSDGTAGLNSITDTAWAAQCYQIEDQSTNSYSLLVVVLIVIAAVAILSVVRMLG